MAALEINDQFGVELVIFVFFCTLWSHEKETNDMSCHNRLSLCQMNIPLFAQNTFLSFDGLPIETGPLDVISCQGLYSRTIYNIS